MVFADHVRDFDPFQCSGRRMERLKAFHRARDLLYETVILLDNIVQIFDLKDIDQVEPSV